MTKTVLPTFRAFCEGNHPEKGRHFDEISKEGSAKQISCWSSFDRNCGEFIQRKKLEVSTRRQHWRNYSLWPTTIFHPEKSRFGIIANVTMLVHEALASLWSSRGSTVIRVCQSRPSWTNKVRGLREILFVIYDQLIISNLKSLRQFVWLNII